MDDGRRQRKVVRPRAVSFGEIDEKKLKQNLALPPIAEKWDDSLIILFRSTFYHASEDGCQNDKVVICGIPFSLQGGKSVQEYEDEWLQKHDSLITEAKKNYLKNLDENFVDNKGLPQPIARNQSLARGALEKLAKLEEAERRAEPALANCRDGYSASPSALNEFYPGFEKSLFVEDERFELLFPEQFFARWQRGFHGEICQHVLSRKTSWSAKELSAYLQKESKKANAKSLSVVRHRLHSRVEPIAITLAGLDLVPDVPDGGKKPGKRSDFFSKWQKALEFSLRRQFIEELVK